MVRGNLCARDALEIPVTRLDKGNSKRRGGLSRRKIEVGKRTSDGENIQQRMIK